MEAGEEPGDQDPAENTSVELGYIFKNDNTRFELVGYQNDIVLYAWNDEIKTPEKSEYGTKGGELFTYKADTFSLTTSHSRHELKESLMLESVSLLRMGKI